MTLAELNNLNEIDNKDLDLKITDFENSLTVYEDKNHNAVYNLNSILKINIDLSVLKEYTCISEIHWPIVSYNIYGTTRLAWLLMNFNNVNITNIFSSLEPGTKIKFLPKEYLRTLLSEIQLLKN